MWLEYWGDIDALIFYVFCAVAALVLVLAVVILILGCVFKVTTPGISMDFYIAVGGLALVVTVLLRGLDPSWWSLDSMGITCELYPSLLTFGLLWVIAGLLLRSCAIVSYMRNPGKRAVRSEWKPNLGMIFLMAIDAAVVIVWTVLFPMEIHMTHGLPQSWSDKLVQMDALANVKNTTMYWCDGEYAKEFQIGVSSLHAGILLFAAIMVWPALHLSKKRDTSVETNFLAVATYNFLFSVVAGLLVYFMLATTPSYYYAIMGGLMLYATFITLLIVMISKIVSARRARYDDDHYNRVESDRGTNSGSRRSHHSNRESGGYTNPVTMNEGFDY